MTKEYEFRKRAEPLTGEYNTADYQMNLYEERMKKNPHDEKNWLHIVAAQKKMKADEENGRDMTAQRKKLSELIKKYI